MSISFVTLTLPTYVDNDIGYIFTAVRGNNLDELVQVGTLQVGKLGSASACLRCLFVHEQFRRQGVGKALVEAAIMACKRWQGFTTPDVLGTSISREIPQKEIDGLINFYTKLGFEFAYQFETEFLYIHRLAK